MQMISIACRVSATLLLLGMAGGAWAQAAAKTSPEAQRLDMRALAATCAQCHGTDGKGPGFDRLAGPQVIQNILWLFGCGASRRSLTRASRS